MIRRLLLLLVATALGAAEPARPFYGARPGALEKAKAAAATDESVAKALKKLITDADKADATRRFWRGDTSTPGTGLGLAIVEALARASGGVVELTDTPGGGLTVGVTFRKA